jgi:hypothetical protein
MTTLQPATQSKTRQPICEIWAYGRLLGVIYPTARGVKIVSKYLEATPDLVEIDAEEPPAVSINILRPELPFPPT